MGERGARRRGVLPELEMDARRLGRQATELLEKGYDFKLEYVGEAAANPDGGYDDDKTGRYTDQFAPGVHMDRRRSSAGRLPSSSSPSPAQRQEPSNDRIGDPRAGHISSVQEVWGRGRTWRLTQLWLKQRTSTARWT
ncbi:hypothetical protein P4234_18660 [Pseudomonas aeruginosa]|nr:hypothetical protein [Pseudomonas aeruginosa]